MANKKTWIRYTGSVSPDLQGEGAPTCRIEPGKWYEVPADFAAQFEGKGWEKAEKNPALPKSEKKEKALAPVEEVQTESK